MTSLKRFTNCRESRCASSVRFITVINFYQYVFLEEVKIPYIFFSHLSEDKSILFELLLT